MMDAPLQERLGRWRSVVGDGSAVGVHIIPGKGLGVVAEEDIPRGTCVATWQLRAFAQDGHATAPTRVYLGGDKMKGGGRRTRTTALVADVDDELLPREERAEAPAVGWLLNEPCLGGRPNCRNYFAAGDETTCVLGGVVDLEIHTTRKVQKGEELTWTYGAGYDRDYKQQTPPHTSSPRRVRASREPEAAARGAERMEHGKRREKGVGTARGAQAKAKRKGEGKSPPSRPPARPSHAHRTRPPNTPTARPHPHPHTPPALSSQRPRAHALLQLVLAVHGGQSLPDACGEVVLRGDAPRRVDEAALDLYDRRIRLLLDPHQGRYEALRDEVIHVLVPSIRDVAAEDLDLFLQIVPPEHRLVVEREVELSLCQPSCRVFVLRASSIILSTACADCATATIRTSS